MHKCRAIGCNKEIALTLLMCRSHWYMVPKAIRAAIWATAPRFGRTPSTTYAINVRTAITAVQLAEMSSDNG